MEKELVFRNESGVAVTTSYLVAETFGKKHKNVLQDIDKLECSETFRGLNFQLSFKIRELLNGGSKEERYFNITKDGFTILAMGYTGKKAMEFKEKYIAAFNKMANQLIIANQQQAQLTQQLLSTCEKLESMNNRLEFIEKRVLTVDKKKKPAKPKYLTISEAISVFAAKVRCIGKEDFYHCLRELEHLSKDEEDYNRPQGQYALTDMITAVNVKPNPEDADTEDQDFTLLITPGFLNIVIETVKWYEAYDMGYFSDLLVKDRPYCRK
ncbi:MAG: Rha family transcriptional regulator [Bacteroidaceae bacterium]|nr:Rha family transcriptional regulator [Bacteroidaceae bacterium]